MGCNSSMDNQSITNREDTARENQGPAMHTNRDDKILEFVRLDEKIYKLESNCPGPRLATCTAWIEHLQMLYNSLAGIEVVNTPKTSDNILNNIETNLVPPDVEILTFPPENNLNSAIIINNKSKNPLNQYNQYTAKTFENSNGNIIQLKDDSSHLPGYINPNQTQDLLNLALNLQVIGDVQKSAKHEDFFAQMSNSYLHTITLECYTVILKHMEERQRSLQEDMTALSSFYVHNDTLLSVLSGGTYVNRLDSSLDGELETARSVRDKLGTTLEQWRICGLLLRASSNSAKQSLAHWKRLKAISNSRTKLEITLASRKDLQMSLVSLECAQRSLPDVEFKYISNRQILAAKHCSIYMITDVSNNDRYQHTFRVIKAYDSDVSKATHWLYETFDKTLRIDFDRANDTVDLLARALRVFREQHFQLVDK